jgi:hypothetical protein
MYIFFNVGLKSTLELVLLLYHVNIYVAVNLMIGGPDISGTG